MNDSSTENIQQVLNGLSIHGMKNPLNGLEKTALVSLENAVVSIRGIVEKVDQMVWIAKQNSENPSDGLTVDESASIAVLTMEWYPEENSVGYCLNTALRAENHEQLKPWFPYLKLLFHAVSKLPKVSHLLYRGYSGNNANEYQEGREFVLWELSTWVSNINTLENEDDFVPLIFIFLCCVEIFALVSHSTARQRHQKAPHTSDG